MEVLWEYYKYKERYDMSQFFYVGAVNPNDSENKASIASMLDRKGPTFRALFGGQNN
jgi:hypothetical protein